MRRDAARADVAASQSAFREWRHPARPCRRSRRRRRPEHIS